MERNPLDQQQFPLPKNSPVNLHSLDNTNKNKIQKISVTKEPECGVDGNSLYYLLNFSINLKMVLKLKS